VIPVSVAVIDRQGVERSTKFKVLPDVHITMAKPYSMYTGHCQENQRRGENTKKETHII
jgi:hypothetical protein